MKTNSTRYVLLKTFIALTVVCFSMPLTAQDQDVIYLVDETPVKGKVVEVTGKRVKYKKESGQIRSYEAEQVIMLFNEAGSFLIFPPLQLTPEIANNFINSDSRPTFDMLITLNKQVIPGIIISANENEVMYQDAHQQKGERSIGKDVLALIIFKNGQHELLVSPSQASEILYATKDSIAYLNTRAITQQNEEKTVSSPQNALKHESANASSEEAAGAGTQRKTEVLPKTKGKQPASAELAISQQELIRLHSVALRKIQELTNYIKILSDVQTDRLMVKQTIDLACALFVDEDARVEVANAQTGVKNKYKIKDYLNRLTMRTGQFEKIDIDYANIYYASDLVKNPDGNYHRQIEYMQTCKGFSNGNIIYGDLLKQKTVVTQKNIAKKDALSNQQLWDIFLSDIGVVEAQKF